jgi:RNA polymerase sigma factor (sigma-70 family)
MAATAEDLALVSGLLDGDPVAGVALDRRYRPRLMWLAQTAGVPLQDREDVVQETLAAGLSQIERGVYRGECSLGRWLEVILRGKIIDHQRSRGRLVLASDCENESSDGSAPSIIEMVAVCPNLDTVLTVREILGKMPKRHRILLVLNKTVGLTIEEIAAKFGWPSGSVSRIIAEGKHMFYEMFRERAKKTDESIDRVWDGHGIP